jgi:uncharacterized protein (DUF433 family)
MSARIPVATVVGLFAKGLSVNEIHARQRRTGATDAIGC